MSEARTGRVSPQLLRLSAAILVGTLTALALFDWVFDQRVTARLTPPFMAIEPANAVALLLALLALALPLRHNLLVRFLAALVFAIGAAKLLQILMGGPGSIDLLLFPGRLVDGASLVPSRMEPNIAIAVVWLGAALFAGVSRHRYAVLCSQILGLAVGAIALLAVVHSLVDAVARDPGQTPNSMAVGTALALAMFAIAVIGRNRGVGLMRVLGDSGPAGSLARTALPFAMLLPVLVGVAQLSGERGGFFGTGDGVALQVFANIVVTFAMLAGCILMLSLSDKTRRDRELATALSEGQYRHAEQVGHIGHWRIEFPSGGVQWSDELYAICGLPQSTVPSLEAKFALFHPEDRGGPLERVKQAIRDCREWEVEHRIVRPDGEARHVKSHGVCERDAQGGVTAIFGVLIDTTELELARREAEAATASKAAFLANMSHEIRTPMNGVMGFVELLIASKLDAKQRRHLLLVQESAQALLNLLNDILDLSKIEAGQLDLSVEPTNIRHDVTLCVGLMTPAAEQKGLGLKVSFADGFPDNVLIDSLRFRQILFNLLGNAVKFTNRGSVSVAVREALGPAGRRNIEINIEDTGVGIANGRKAAIFDAFVQADASVSRQFGGSGLGLSISRNLARLMGGTITLESEEGEGTVATFTLPLDEVFAPTLTAVRPPRGKRGTTPGAETVRRQASVLLVEDIDINQELITEMLNRLGHSVEVAKDGSEALAMAGRLAAEPDAWDMILMDVQMPVMDGLTATRAIRALGGRAATIPIVALTANAFAVEMEACREAGMDDHIAKPSGFAQLRHAVELWGNVGQSRTAPTEFGALETVSIADRFEARLHKSNARLIELAAELSAAKDEEATPLMREAAGIAHVLAGTAAMFGRAPLGNVAHEVETAIKAIAGDQSTGRSIQAAEAIGRLLAALDIRPRRSAALASASAHS